MVSDLIIFLTSCKPMLDQLCDNNNNNNNNNNDNDNNDDNNNNNNNFLLFTLASAVEPR